MPLCASRKVDLKISPVLWGSCSLFGSQTPFPLSIAGSFSEHSFPYFPQDVQTFRLASSRSTLHKTFSPRSLGLFLLAFSFFWTQGIDILRLAVRSIQLWTLALFPVVSTRSQQHSKHWHSIQWNFNITFLWGSQKLNWPVLSEPPPL